MFLQKAPANFAPPKTLYAYQLDEALGEVFERLLDGKTMRVGEWNYSKQTENKIPMLHR